MSARCIILASPPPSYLDITYGVYTNRLYARHTRI
jgi:hypothetical protein